MLKRILKNEKGLTLIELLAVVVILGIIAAIAVPAIGKIIDDSRDKAVVSDALQIINAAKIAKAANPKVNIFVGGSETEPGDGEVDLDQYLDSEVPAGVKVTFTEDDVWQIEGHDELFGPGDIVGIGNFEGENVATEQQLVAFLDGDENYIDAGETGEPS